MNRDWIKVDKFISIDTANLLYQHVKMAEKRHKDLESHGVVISDSVYGKYNDGQIEGKYCFSMYGDLIMDTVLVDSKKKIENIIDEKLIPQYTYYRMYLNGSELPRHKDREQCELSSTLCLGYDANYNWPIWVKDRHGKEIPIELEPGDMVIYKGCDIEHWREPFRGNNHAQVFLHYNLKDGPFSHNHLDGRVSVGIPHPSNTKHWFRGNK